jgi:hypothetical protein
MRRLALILAATTFGAGYAVAEDTTIIQHNGSPGVAVEHQSTTGSTTVEKRTETTGSVGCSTTTKQKTDEFGDTKTKKTTEC